MILKNGLVSALCIAVVMGIALTSGVEAGARKKSVKMNKAQFTRAVKQAKTSKPIRQSNKVFGVNQSGSTKDEVPIITDINKAIKFIEDCEAAGGGVSNEPHPDGKHVIMVCN